MTPCFFKQLFNALTEASTTKRLGANINAKFLWLALKFGPGFLEVFEIWTNMPFTNNMSRLVNHCNQEKTYCKICHMMVVSIYTVDFRTVFNRMLCYGAKNWAWEKSWQPAYKLLVLLRSSKNFWMAASIKTLKK